MIKFADRVKETSTTTGTGVVNLEGAAAGFRSFSSAFTTGDLVGYCIEDGTNWEVGEGTLTTGTPWTLTRSAVLSSSNASALVDFPAGVKAVFCTSSANDVGPLVTPKELYIAPTGDDTTGLGTLASPWKSLSKAMAEALSRPIRGVGEVNINCAAGVYADYDQVRVNSSDAIKVNIVTSSSPEPGITGVYSVPTRWVASTAYALGDIVVSSTIADGAEVTWYYKCTLAGTSSSSEPAFSGTSTYVDGSVQWTRKSTQGSCEVTFSVAYASVAVVDARLFIEASQHGGPKTAALSGGHKIVAVDTTNNRVTVEFRAIKFVFPSVGVTTAYPYAYVVKTVLYQTDMIIHSCYLNYLGDICLNNVIIEHGSIYNYDYVQIFTSLALRNASINMWTAVVSDASIRYSSRAYLSSVASGLLSVTSADAYITILASRGSYSESGGAPMYISNSRLEVDIVEAAATGSGGKFMIVENSHVSIYSKIKDCSVVPFTIEGGGYVNASYATVTNTPTLSNLTNDTLSADGSFIKTV